MLVLVSLVMIGCILIAGCGAPPTASTEATTTTTVIVESATVATTNVGTATAGSEATTAATPEVETTTAGSATTTAATPEVGTITTTTATAATTTETTPTPSAGGQTGTIQPEDKLSARLNILSDPSVSAQDPAAQAKAVSLPPKGRGSLIRNAQGELLVSIRLSDTSAATIDALRKAGATIVNVYQPYRTATAYVRPDRLRGIVAGPAVENISEQLSP